MRRWSEHGSAKESKSHGVVTCITIVGNEAWLGGYATSGAYSDPPNGVAWRVKDNGEGKRSGPDQISLQYVATTADYPFSYCARTPGHALSDIEAGNIQIKQ
jgi:hypothetical protein